MPKGVAAACVIVIAAAAACAMDVAPAPALPPPVVFEGFGLGDLSSAASVGRALRATDTQSASRGARAVDVIVQGPGAGAIGPLAAEVRGRIDGFDVAGGVQGDAEQFVGRMPRWTGRIGLGSSGPDGGRSLEVRTLLEPSHGGGRVGVQIGPRIERRLRRGTRIFLDGAATAEAVREPAEGGWRLPGTSTADSMATAGVSASTGIIR